MNLILIYQDIFLLTLGVATFLAGSPEMQKLIFWRVLQSLLCQGTDTDGSDVSGDKQIMCTTWEIVSKLTLCSLVEVRQKVWYNSPWLIGFRGNPDPGCREYDVSWGRKR